MSKKRCEFIITENKICNKKVSLCLETCTYCKKHYCGQHYLMESHNCEKKEDYIIKTRAALKISLESNKANFPKIDKI